MNETNVERKRCKDMKTLTAIIEKANDGGYSVYADGGRRADGGGVAGDEAGRGCEGGGGGLTK